MIVEITESPLDFAHLVERVRTPSCGAVVLFLGTVRDHSEGRETTSLDYEAHESMAVKEITAVLEEARQRWPLGNVAVLHRIGHLELGDVAVAVATASAHRAAAFDSAEWIMDTIKERVPIWKRENWADGSADWVHPVTP